MHVQIVNFQLKDMTEAEFQEFCRGAVPAMQALPGLITKVWLADTAANTYGGIYIWQDRAAMEAYQRSEIYASIGAHPNLTNITSRDFAVLDEFTRKTWELTAASV